jgi:hypothetical protein
MIILKFCNYVLINELYKNKIFNWKSCLESMHYCNLTTKNILGLKKIQRKWTFKFVNSCHFWSTLPCTYTSSFWAHAFCIKAIDLCKILICEWITITYLQRFGIQKSS